MEAFEAAKSCEKAAAVAESIKAHDEGDARSPALAEAAKLCAEAARSRAKAEAANLRVEVINILILGETGVGKSTWINGFVNYVTYPTLDDAMSNTHEEVAVIPSKLSITDDDGETKTIFIGGENQNESHEDGQSATQSCQTYLIDSGDKKIRLIDTPGIGDVRGIEYDKMNMENILQYLSVYDQINAICILLRPNEARATPSFRFCINELLKSFDKSASDSIAFCFSNARGTMYKPGETKCTLATILKEIRGKSSITLDITKGNTFCMDNEAFRFLACHRSGVSFDDDDKDVYANSWKQSAKTARKLVEFAEKQLLDTTVTICLNEARETIIRLQEPMAKIQGRIKDTILKIKDAEKEIADSTKTLNANRSGENAKKKKVPTATLR